jgi:hypothetical protein
VSLAKSAAPNNLCFCLVSQSKEEISLSLITAGGQMSVEENMRLMKTLDDKWDTQDWDTFNRCHTEDVACTGPVK